MLAGRSTRLRLGWTSASAARVVASARFARPARSFGLLDRARSARNGERPTSCADATANVRDCDALWTWLRRAAQAIVLRFVCELLDFLAENEPISTSLPMRVFSNQLPSGDTLSQLRRAKFTSNFAVDQPKSGTQAI